VAPLELLKLLQVVYNQVETQGDSLSTISRLLVLVLIVLLALLMVEVRLWRFA
jgi:hypothetical protein